MNGYYSQSPYGSDTARVINDPSGGANMMDMIAADQMSGAQMVGSHSLDDIVSHNAKELRRRSMPIGYPGADGLDGNIRRSSMMEFGDGSPQMESFQFDPAAAAGLDASMQDLSPHMDGGNRAKRTPPHGLSINTQFQPAPVYGAMRTAPSYASPIHVNGTLDMDSNSPYITSGIPMSMDMTILGNDMAAMDMFGGQNFESPMLGSPMPHSFAGSVIPPGHDPGGGGGALDNAIEQRVARSSENSSATPDYRKSTSRTNSHDHSHPPSSRTTSNSGPVKPPNQILGIPQTVPTSSYSPQALQQSTSGPEMIGGQILPWTTPSGGWPSTMYGRPHIDTEFKDVYAPSGFDLLNILMRVGSRVNPRINIGAVDLSCAFVVCDARQHDSPIRYCSESFERLTGYSKHEIGGQNCRFLQSPDGKVEAGIKRKYCDDDAVLYLKNCIAAQEEAQISLINYRKGGQPFMNLLTMIPLLDQAGKIEYFVGFQVDLVERPNAISSKNLDGTFSVNYQRQADLPGYYLHAPDASILAEFGQTVPRDEVSAVLSTMSSGESELSKRIMDKVLLENCDDVIHVLSLKGLFLYLSPACRRVLEYEPSELVGAALSSVCHPSDIVPVTRELKDSSSGSSVSVVFRIRRKRSGYVWFESHGSLHTEQGKGRKCIILVGRERPVYTLSKNQIYSAAAGGIGEHELWTKMSTSGMYLFVSANVRSLLDRQPEELIGTNIQALMRPDSRSDFDRVLSIVLGGKQASVKHEMTNRKGQVIQAFTWLYPGDAVEGQKPTFLIAQTRLIKYHRGARGSLSKHDSTPGSMPSASPAGVLHGENTPLSGSSAFDNSQYVSTTGHAVTHGGQDSLAIGQQDASLAAEDNVFEELKTTRSTSWQYELRQMEKKNRLLAEEVQSLVSAKKKRKRRRGAGLLQKDCANCHTKHTPEWRRGPSGNRDLCNSCGLRWAKQIGRVSPRTSSQQSVHSAPSDKASKASASPLSDHAIGTVVPVQPTSPERKNFAQGAMADSHAAKVARMEAAAPAGLAGGIPEKIMEVMEPE